MTVKISKETEKIVEELSQSEKRSKNDVIATAVKAYRFDKGWAKVRAARKRILRKYGK